MTRAHVLENPPGVITVDPQYSWHMSADEGEPRPPLPWKPSMMQPIQEHKFSELSWLLHPLLLGSLFYFFLYFLVAGIFSKSLWGEEGVWYANIEYPMPPHITLHQIIPYCKNKHRGAIPSSPSWLSEPRAQIPNPPKGSWLPSYQAGSGQSQQDTHESLRPEIHIGLSSEHMHRSLVLLLRKCQTPKFPPSLSEPLFFSLTKQAPYIPLDHVAPSSDRDCLLTNTGLSHEDQTNGKANHLTFKKNHITKPLSILTSD